MLHKNLVEMVYFEGLNAEDALSAANYPLSGSYIDVSDYERFGFIVHAGALDTATVLQVKQDTAATETASIKNVTGATLTVGATEDDTTKIIEVQTDALDGNGGFHFVTLTITGPTGNDYGSIIFFACTPGDAPVTQPTSDEQVVVTG